MSDRTRSQRLSTIILTLIAIAVVVAIVNFALLAIGTGTSTQWSVTAPEPRPTTATVPLDENVFFPEERAITDCTGFVERPGCGSQARGGTAQTVLAITLFAALGIIGFRIYRGLRRRPA